MADSFIRLINLFDDNIDGIPSVLCSRLFSAHDNDDNVSPDSTDPRVITSADSEIEWPKKEQFNAENIFNKVFCNDIKILQGMLQIWESHKIPKPVKFEIESSMASIEPAVNSRRNHVWDLKVCQEVFTESFLVLLQRSKEKNLICDIEDESTMNFVAASTNIRATIFNLERMSYSEIKCKYLKRTIPRGHSLIKVDFHNCRPGWQATTHYRNCKRHHCNKSGETSHEGSGGTGWISFQTIWCSSGGTSDG